MTAVGNCRRMALKIDMEQVKWVEEQEQMKEDEGGAAMGNPSLARCQPKTSEPNLISKETRSRKTKPNHGLQMVDGAVRMGWDRRGTSRATGSTNAILESQYHIGVIGQAIDGWRGGVQMRKFLLFVGLIVREW